MTAHSTPWAVIASPTDAELFAVQGIYLVADCLPIEDARLIAAAPELAEALREVTAELGEFADITINGVRDERMGGMVDRARALLAKIEGDA